MTTTAPLQATTLLNSTARKATPRHKATPVGRATWVFSAFGLAAAATIVSVAPPYTPGSLIGYRLGLIGGLMMLFLLVYPLRKSWPLLRSLGPIRYWFHSHMVFGIAGPLMVLFHSTFHFGSLNAAVALAAMLLVAASGIVGRFFYARIHNGLYGSLATLEQMLAEREKRESQVRRMLDFAPAIEPLLENIAALTRPYTGSSIGRAWRFATLGWRMRRSWRQCHRVLRTMLKQSDGGARSSHELQQHYREAKALIRCYLSAAQRAAQFRAYERLFSLWHVAHIPFIYLLAASAMVHVIAVHLY